MHELEQEGDLVQEEAAKFRSSLSWLLECVVILHTGVTFKRAMNSKALLSSGMLLRLPAVVHSSLLSKRFRPYASPGGCGAFATCNPALSGRRTFAGKAAPDMEGKQETHEEQPGTERVAYKEDMETSYGEAYSIRSSDEGYGEIYGEAVKKYQTTPDLKENMRGATAERDQNADAFGGTKAGTEYDRSQGHPVAQKEKARHAKHEDAFSHQPSTHGGTGASM